MDAPEIEFVDDDALYDVTRECFAQAATFGYSVAISGPRGAFRADDPGATDLARAVHGTTFNLVCGLKPFIALASVGMLERCGVDAPYHLAVGRTATPEEPVTLDVLLAHQCGLGEPTALEYLRGSERRRGHQRESIRSTPIARKTTTSYSEVAMLVLLDDHLRKLCGRDLHEAVAESAQLLRLTDTFVESSGARESIGCFIEFQSNGRAIPLLHDRTPQFYCRRSIGYVGGFASSTDLCRFYCALLPGLRGENVVGLPTARYLAALLDRDGRYLHGDGSSAIYRAGLMANLRSHGICTASAAGLGHMGFVRASFGYCEPESGLALAGVVKGIDFHRLDRMTHGWADFIVEARRLATHVRSTQRRLVRVAVRREDDAR
jgi:hypothetical protein